MDNPQKSDQNIPPLSSSDNDRENVSPKPPVNDFANETNRPDGPHPRPEGNETGVNADIPSINNDGLQSVNEDEAVEEIKIKDQFNPSEEGEGFREKINQTLKSPKAKIILGILFLLVVGLGVVVGTRFVQIPGIGEIRRGAVGLPECMTDDDCSSGYYCDDYSGECIPFNTPTPLPTPGGTCEQRGGDCVPVDWSCSSDYGQYDCAADEKCGVNCIQIECTENSDCIGPEGTPGYKVRCINNKCESYTPCDVSCCDAKDTFPDCYVNHWVTDDPDNPTIIDELVKQGVDYSCLGYQQCGAEQIDVTCDGHPHTDSTSKRYPNPCITPSPIPTPTNTPTAIPTNTPTLTPTPLPTPTNTPTPTPTPTNTPTPSPTPIPLVCEDLNYTPATPVLGASVSFVCSGSGQALDHYEFQYSVNSSAFVNLTEISRGSGISESLFISDPGPYVIRCRVCQSTDSSNCTAYETL